MPTIEAYYLIHFAKRDNKAGEKNERKYETGKITACDSADGVKYKFTIETSCSPGNTQCSQIWQNAISLDAKFNQNAKFSVLD